MSKFSVSHEVEFSPEQKIEIEQFREAAGRTLNLRIAMMLDPTIGHYDWQGNPRLGRESMFSKFMKKAKLKQK